MADRVNSKFDISAHFSGPISRDLEAVDEELKPVIRGSPEEDNPLAPLPKVKEVTLRDISPSGTVNLSATPEPSSTVTIRMNEITEQLALLEKKLSRLDCESELELINQRIKKIEENIQMISVKLQGTLGYDLYHSYKCDKCGGQGYVATLYKCTQCGSESWRGWWPSKKHDH